MLRSKVWIVSGRLGGRCRSSSSRLAFWCLATPQGWNLHAAPVSISQLPAICDTGELFESARLMALLDRVRATLPLHAQQDMDLR